MIRYDLKCADGHAFDGWYASSDTFDALLRAGQVTCSECVSTHVEKALMAPSVTATSEDRRKALADLKREIEATSTYVGTEFAEEARRIHNGEAPGRSIYGEARLEDVRRLIEDDIPVAPLPFRPTRRAN
ncbi:DUF1178 family protein [Falsirhodobacter halotolerans]|uniref:DUF1178 family protein n=1 Tax=Falsirhodobacter halotolerans TaxID=1146892 RepID=UPI001FCFF02F|nr:DUF1178 family protein [Falsirhodobacter halotolerans]MCJ8139054.1 DUF1178 family protein [Falsirhodobacter halotolerans]